MSVPSFNEPVTFRRFFPDLIAATPAERSNTNACGEPRIDGFAAVAPGVIEDGTTPQSASRGRTDVLNFRDGKFLRPLGTSVAAINTVNLNGLGDKIMAAITASTGSKDSTSPLTRLLSKHALK
jgi:hypothetical protein